MPRGRRGRRGAGRRSGAPAPPSAQPSMSSGTTMVASASEDESLTRRSGKRRSRRDESSSESESETSSSESESSSDSESDSSEEEAPRRSSRRGASRRGAGAGAAPAAVKRVVYGANGAVTLAAAADAAAVVKVPTWQTTEVIFKLKGTPLEFATGKAATMAIAEDAADVFGPGSAKGRSSAHICGRVDLVGIKATSPATIQVTASGVPDDAFSARSVMAGTGQRGLFTLLPGEEMGARELELMRSETDGEKANFVEAFPGMTLEKLDLGVTQGTDGYTHVDAGHPVIKMIATAWKKQKRPGFGRPNHDNTYTLDTPLVDTVLGQAREHFRSVLKQVDLHKMAFHVSRADVSPELAAESLELARQALIENGAAPEDVDAMITDPSWINGEELFSGMRVPDSKIKALNTPLTVSIKARVTHQTLG